MDDVLQNNNMLSICISEPIDKFYTNHILTYQLYKFLYAQFGNISWYGWIFYSYIFITSILLFYYLSILFRNLYKTKYLLFLWICCTFFLLLWVENVFLLNFTKISILITGLSALLLDEIVQSSHYKKSFKVIWIFCLSILLLIGTLTRTEIIGVLFFPFTFYTLRHIRKPKIFFGLASIFIMNGILFTVIFFNQVDEEIKIKTDKVKNILSITEGKNTNDSYFIDKAQEDIRYKALWLYYWPDSTLIQKEQLDKFGHQDWFSSNKLQNAIPNLKYEWESARSSYNEDYCNALNWMYPFLSLLVVNLLLLLVHLLIQRDRFQQLLHFLTIVSLLAVLLFVTFLHKMEGRVVIPSMIIVTLMSVSFIRETIKNTKNNCFVVLMALLMPLSIFQAWAYKQTANDKKKETQAKAAFIDELNSSFKSKIFFFDIYTISLLHLSPFEKIKLNPINKYTSFKENWSVFFPGQMKALENMCGATDFVNFYSCLYEKGDSVIFAHTKDARIGLIEEYAKSVYGIEMEFTEIFTDSKLNMVHYSFIPYKLDFGYYKLTKFVVPDKSIQNP